MRNIFVKTLTDLMRQDAGIITLTADMGFGVFEELRDEFSDRFINTGVAEADTVGIAAGLALSGYTVFFYAQAPFATMRCYEQIRLDISSNNLNVKIIGTSAGFTLSQYGLSHYALEDVAIMRVLPNMKIICPGDLYEAELATKAAYKVKGPVYIRIGRSNNGPDQAIHAKKPNFQIGRSFFLNKGKDAAIIATGSMLFAANQAVKLLKENNIHVDFISMPTIKPIDRAVILKIVKNKKIIFTAEEHSIIGGLGSAVAEIAAENWNSAKIIRLGAEDKFLHIAGSRDYLLERNNLTPILIAKRIIKELKRGNVNFPKI